MTKPVLVVIDTKSMLCRRFEGKTCTHNVQALGELLQMDIDQIRNQPETISDPEPESA